MNIYIYIHTYIYIHIYIYIYIHIYTSPFSLRKVPHKGFRMWGLGCVV